MQQGEPGKRNDGVISVDESISVPRSNKRRIKHPE